MKIIYIVFLLCLGGRAAAQSPAFSQFYSLPTAMNPAYISAVEGMEFSAGYRKQWGQVQAGFDTKFAAAALRICQAPIGFGIYLSDVHESLFGYHRQDGGLQIGGFLGNPKRFSLHGALQAGIGQHRVDFARLLFSSQLDPVFGIQSAPTAYFLNDGSRVQTFEIGFGSVARGLLRWRNRDLPASAGFSVQHLGGSRDVSFLRLPNTQDMHWTIHGSLTTPITGGPLRKDVLYLNWLARLEWESALQRGTTGVIFQYEATHIGVLYQWNNSPFTSKNTHGLTLSFGYDLALNDHISCTLQYAFDGTLGGLGQAASGGAHELTARFSLPGSCAFKRNQRGKTDCFDYWGKGYRRFLN